ncbi:hypothetical protein DFH29DRAFT_880204 [Suillus ampliporus]|nr:hypothetical protein DFH29DRAFT_880204 [Suillus ampliporus]
MIAEVVLDSRISRAFEVQESLPDETSQVTYQLYSRDRLQTAVPECWGSEAKIMRFTYNKDYTIGVDKFQSGGRFGHDDDEAARVSTSGENTSNSRLPLSGELNAGAFSMASSYTSTSAFARCIFAPINIKASWTPGGTHVLNRQNEGSMDFSETGTAGLVMHIEAAEEELSLRTIGTATPHIARYLAAQRHFQLTSIPLLFHESSFYEPTHRTIPNSTSQRLLPLRLQQPLPNYLPNITEVDSTFEQEVEQIQFSPDLH